MKVLRYIAASGGWVALVVLAASLLLPVALAGPGGAGSVADGSQVAAVAAPAAEVSQATPVPPRDRERYTRGDSNIQYRWGMLMDSLALAVSYVWLCCGVIVVLAIPLFFVVLWVKGRKHPQS